jgi:hypothetical protein
MWFIHNCFRFQILFQVKLFPRDLENQIVQWVEFAITLFASFFSSDTFDRFLIHFESITSQFFLKTQKCKFGTKCKFNHPNVPSENADVSGLPERPQEPPCAVRYWSLSYASNTLVYWLKFIWAPLSLCGAYMI